jgi:hypothetical protein
MKVRRLLTLAVLAFAFACDQKAPTDPPGIKPPSDPSMIISDGAHGGNPDFFFLPPLLPNPSNSPNYETGRANTRLGSGLTVEICELQAPPINAQGLPVATDCIAGPPLKKFPAGTVKLADSGNDGFYMAQWKPSESNLVLSKYYRIKVLLEGSTVPLGAADLDPVANQKELKNVLTGEVIPLTADGTLPIKFRVEKGGGPPVCGIAVLCTSTVVTNNSPTGSTIVTVDGGSGAVAGAKFPNGWLPTGGPQSVVVTIASVNTGISDPVTGTEATPCHAGLNLQQFRGCFNFTTTPRLDPINGESGPQFAIPVTVAVCYVLQGTGDPREKFAEMWASGPNEPPHPLDDASDVGILSANTRDCSNSVIGLNNSKGISGLASASWRKLKGGLGSFFGVKTAYAVDIGLGGFLSEFSNVGPVLSAEIHPYTSADLTLPPGTTTTATARIVGSNHHATHDRATGLGGLAVTFTVTEGNGSLKALGSEGPPLSAVTVITNTNPIDGSPVSGGGFAPVNWTVPETPGTYTLTANGPAIDGPVTFTATVTGSLPFINFETYPAGAGVCDGSASCDVTDEFASKGVVFEFEPFIDVSNIASLCLKPFNPVGETPNYGVSPLALSGCSSWATGVVTMRFAENPTTVEFQLQGNNTLTEGPFEVTAVGGNEQPVTVTRESVVTYSPSTGLTFRREIRRATSPNGIASVSVTSGTGVIFIDNLLITQ